MQEPGQKIIDLETAVQMLNITMVSDAHLAPFIEFLQEQKDYKTINLDQWQGFGRFTQEVSFEPIPRLRSILSTRYCTKDE